MITLLMLLALSLPPSRLCVAGYPVQVVQTLPPEQPTGVLVYLWPRQVRGLYILIKDRAWMLVPAKPNEVRPYRFPCKQ